jgi:hypothetical protein
MTSEQRRILSLTSINEEFVEIQSFTKNNIETVTVETLNKNNGRRKLHIYERSIYNLGKYAFNWTFSGEIESV